MKNFILSASVLAIAACTTMSDARVAQTVTSAIAAERTAAIRCPRPGTERTVFLVGRIAVDAMIGGRVTLEQRAALDAARTATDRVCGITPTDRADAQQSAAQQGITPNEP